MVVRSARCMWVKKVVSLATWNSTQDDSVRYSPYTRPAQTNASQAGQAPAPDGEAVLAEQPTQSTTLG